MQLIKTYRCLLCIILLLPGILKAQQTNTIQYHSKNREVTMSEIQQNKAVVQKLYEQCLNKRKFALLQQLVADDFTSPDGKQGAAAFEAPIALLIHSFPDIQWTLEDLIGEGNKVVAKWKWTGTNERPFQNLEANNKIITNDGMAIYELKNGKITAAKLLMERLGFLQQLGVISSNISLVPNKNMVRFIDHFFVPSTAITEFKDRMQLNRAFIKKLPGFIEDALYQRLDEAGNLDCITIAVWENENAVQQAKTAVQAEYKKQGFDMPGMLKRLQVRMERGIYSMAEN